MKDTATGCPWCGQTDPTKPPRRRWRGLVVCRNPWHPQHPEHHTHGPKNGSSADHREATDA